MTTRRDFLFQLGAAGTGWLMLRMLPGCEHIDIESKVPGQAVRFITPAEDGEWYWQSGQGIAKDEAPEIDREAWSLEIETGSGSTETLDFSDLRERADAGEALTYIKTMRCVFGTSIGTLTDSLVSTGVFTGIPLHRLLEDLDLPDEAVKLRTFGRDGFESNIPLDRALDASLEPPLPVMLAYDLNGRPLSRLRGGPVRLVIPEMWGYKNMKWLERLAVTEDDSFFGTYETERFAGNPAQDIIDDPGKIALMSIITQPTVNTAEVAGPDVTLAGASFAGSTGIDRVELSLDGGDFEPLEIPSPDQVAATLDDTTRAAFEGAHQVTDVGDETGEASNWPPANVWATWSKTFEGLSTGSHAVTVRATDRNDRTQSSETDQRLVVAPEVRIEFEVT